MIINLISGPRNVSTALMYSFAQRDDTEVLDEPFYGVYLHKTGLPHPGRDAIVTALPTDEHEVASMIAASRKKPVLFLKNMAHHLEILDNPVIGDSVNLFLIRDPQQILASYSQVISHPTMRDIGLAYQLSLFEQLRLEGHQPVVIDSRELLLDPPKILAEVCNRCGLPFDQRMVHWPSGPKPYDGVWASHWYGNVHQSTGFERPAGSSRTLPGHLQTLHAEARTCYEKLAAFSLKA